MSAMKFDISAKFINIVDIFGLNSNPGVQYYKNSFVGFFVSKMRLNAGKTGKSRRGRQSGSASDTSMSIDYIISFVLFMCTTVHITPRV